MRRAFPALTLLPALLVPLLASAGSPPAEELMRSSDHKALAKAVGDYWDAKLEKKGIQESFDKLVDKLEKVQEKLDEGANVLAALDDWRQIFWLATERGLDKPKAGRVIEDDDEEPTITYLVSRTYKSNKGPYPLLLIVPDEGQSPADALALWEDEGLRSEAILVVAHMEGDASTWTTQDGIFQVMYAYGRVAQSNRFAFDFNEVFLAGHGKGFPAVVATASAFPQLFAGVLGRGDVGEASPRNLRNVPSWLSAGDASDAFHGQVGELGYDNCSVEEDGTAAAWTWMQGHARNPYASHITFYPPLPSTKSAGWVEAQGINTEGAPVIEAIADRASNTITIQAADISSLVIYLNDVLVNLDQPVKVSINGTTHEEVGPRNRRFMIDEVYQNRDWSRIFTKRVEYEVPESRTE